MSVRIPFSEMLKSVPGFFGIRLEEKPRYEVMEDIGEVEIRRYAPALLAQVTVAGAHDAALDAAFDRLAGYIFGGNAEGKEMAMTNPVYQMPGIPGAEAVARRSASGERWTVAFFLANDMQPREAPAPNDPAIELVVAPEQTVGVLRYSGNDSDDRRRDAKSRLLAAVEGHERWRVDEEVYWAQYDAPFTLPFVKRNEAQVALLPV